MLGTNKINKFLVLLWISFLSLLCGYACCYLEHQFWFLLIDPDLWTHWCRMVAVFCFQNTIPCVLGVGRVWRYLWSQTRLVVPFLRRLRPESPNAHHRPTGDTTWLGTQSNQIKSIFVILYLFLSTQINITTGYLVLCKQDLFRYNIIRRNKS